MEIKYRPYRAIQKAIRIIESCKTFEQLIMAYKFVEKIGKFYPEEYHCYDRSIWMVYDSKYNELKPKEDNNEFNS